MRSLSPPTLTRDEQKVLLAASEAHARDHLTFSLALGTGLRLAELVGLDVGDLYSPAGQPRTRVRIRAEITKGGRASDVFLPDAVGPKFRRFRGHKLRAGEALNPKSPLFCNQWQGAAGFDRLYPLHALRHTAVTNVSQAT